MVANSATLQRIYDGTLTALARRGVDKLTMSDICTESGISRGTLYRHFKTKDHVLTAIAEHVEQGLLAALAESVERQPALADRVDVVVDTIMSFGTTHPESARVIVAEPAFALQFIHDAFPTFVSAVERWLEPALKDSEAVRTGRITSAQLAELILRLASTTFFIPPADASATRRLIGVLPQFPGPGKSPA